MSGPKPPEITIRPYVPSDLPALVDLLHGSVRRVARRDYSHDQVVAWAPEEVDWEARARRHSSRPTWVAEIGGVVAGFADLEADGHIDFMYVHADHQGKGIASLLLKRIESAAREQALGRLFAEVSVTARPFFERRGFRVQAENSVSVRGQTLSNFRMEKMLGAGPRTS
jgi:putative acetyltransferase